MDMLGELLEMACKTFARILITSIIVVGLVASGIGILIGWGL